MALVWIPDCDMNYEVLMLLHLNIDIGSYDCVLVDLFKIIFDRSMRYVMA